MKKILLITFAVGFGFVSVAQKSPAKIRVGTPTVSMENYNHDDAVKAGVHPSLIALPQSRGTAEISVINLGTSANAYGLYSGGRTALWADPTINTVTFAHRMLTPGSGYIAYDVSKDGGSTWTVNNQVFDPTVLGNARYPQGVIYNPQGNTNPDNAYFTSFFPTLDAASNWGAYGTATVKLDGTGLNQQGWPSNPPIRQNVPDAMTINPVTGDVFVVDPSVIDGLGNQYVDTLVITRGVFNATSGAYDYEQTLLYAPVNVFGTSIADSKIAFAPDGMVGYIMTLSDNGEDIMATGLAFYPILYKTMDGGVTWDETPITVPLSGDEGLPGIVNDLLTDDQIAEVFVEPFPARNEIVYTTAFTSDFAVDAFGNPVISVVVGVAGSDPYTFVSGARLFASYNIFGNGQGQDWYAVKLGENLITFRGEWGDISEDNRSQLTTTYDGTKMFFSWLDTDFEGVTDNLQPDIYCAGWDVVNNRYTEVVNVTYLSDAWLQAFMGTASYYAFTPAAGTYEIPFVYQEMDPTNTLLPVTYKYIKNFIFTDADFTIINTEKIDVTAGTVSQNYPNPFNKTSEVRINLVKKADVSLEVFDMIGKKVYEIPSISLGQGSHILTIIANGLRSGIYTYSVVINQERTTRKMIVD